MTPEETNMVIELKDALTDTLEAVRKAFSNSGYYQLIEYKATNDKYENWLFRSNAILKKVNSHLKIN